GAPNIIATSGIAIDLTSGNVLYKKNPEKAKQLADEIIKNTYRTLMTRGMKGCYVYCTDKRLEEYLKKCLK
ncbi:MAG: DUF2075 domain-containing protein, partial [Bacteroidales bacterium]|nr:DUF2075 domain-containing protein [Bacteroidales bacterium]